jgi:hypothetical protein
VNTETLKLKLINDLKSGRVVKVLGTGISVATTKNQEINGCKVSTWIGLLNHGIHHCKNLNLINEKEVRLLEMQLEIGQTDFLVMAAETISKRLQSSSKGVFRGWLKDTVGALRAVDASLIETIEKLPGVIATLNYDNLIEDVTERHAVTWNKPDHVEDVLNGHDPKGVLHLHGWYKEPDSVVLGLSSYATVKDDPHSKSVLELFTIGKTIVFLGCGATFEDQNFQRLIEWAAKAIDDVAPRHFLLCLNGEIQKYQSMLSQAPWIQMLPYGENHADLLPFLRGLADLEEPLPIKTTGDLNISGYKKAMRARYGRLKLEELDATTSDIKPLFLTTMFIEQYVKECAAFVPRIFELPKELQQRLRRSGELSGAEIDANTLEQYHKAYLDQSPRLVSDIVMDADCSRIIVLGDPGSGKSTLLQHILMKWVEADSLSERSVAVPFLIELRDFALYATPNDDFLEYLNHGAPLRWHFNKDLLRERLNSSPAIFLFDGLDEVFDPDQRRAISTKIRRFTDEFPLVKVIVTSRVVGYNHQSWQDEGFRHFMLQDLDASQVTSFLERWHVDTYDDSIVGENKRNLLERAISESAAIRQLSGNPLLLTMMAILNRTQDLPRDRAGLYEQCARLLLHQWKVDMAFASDPDLVNPSLDFNDKRSLLLRVARAMHSGANGLAGNLIDEETLQSTLATGLREMGVSRHERVARSLIDQLRGRNFMLSFMGGKSYAFVHRTFLEYFCAVEIKERFEKEQSITIDELKTQIYGRWEDETWHEVLCLLSGTIAEKFVQEILNWVLIQPDPENTQRNVFLALRCLGEVRNRAKLSKVDLRLRRIAEDLTLYDHPFHYRPWHDEAVKIDLVRTEALRAMWSTWGNSVDVIEWIKKIAETTENWDLRNLAAEILVQASRDNANLLLWLISKAENTGNVQLTIAVMDEFGAVFPSHGAVRKYVKAHMKSKNNFLRASAMRHFIWEHRNDPNIIQIFKNLISQDNDYLVFYVAVKEISRARKGDLSIYSMFVDVLSRTEHAPLKRIIISILGEDWRDTEQTFEVIANITSSAEDEALKVLALETLKQYWGDDNRVFRILVDGAKPGNAERYRWRSLSFLVSLWSSKDETLDSVVSALGDNSDGLRMNTIRELWRLSEREEMFSILIGLFHSERLIEIKAAVLKSLARGWSGRQEIISLLLETIRKSNKITLRKTAIEEFMRQKYDAPQKLATIKQLIDEEVNLEIRLIIIKNISALSVNDDELEIILSKFQGRAESTAVRFALVRNLSEHWPRHPLTFNILRGILSGDRNAVVRRYAAGELIRRANEDVELGGVLKAVLQKDRSKEVRMEIAKGLSRQWRGNAEIFTFLSDYRKFEKNAEIRKLIDEELLRFDLAEESEMI